MIVPFTSGSTGRPKGVLAHHRGVLNRLRWQWKEYPVSPGEVFAAKTSLSFVDHIWEVWGCLLSGSELLMITDHTLTDLDGFVAELEREGIQRISMVPSLLEALLDRFDDLGQRLPQLRYWTVSGEILSRSLARRFAGAVPTVCC